MAYNKNVTMIEFQVASGIDADLVTSSIQRKLEAWSGVACPLFSRFAMTPFTLVTLETERHRRSAEMSVPRNKVKSRIYNWEREWLDKMFWILYTKFFFKKKNTFVYTIQFFSKYICIHNNVFQNTFVYTQYNFSKYICIHNKVFQNTFVYTLFLYGSLTVNMLYLNRKGNFNYIYMFLYLNYIS